MGKTKSKKPKGKGNEGDWDDGKYELSPQGDFDISPKDKKPMADLSDALLELDTTNKPPESTPESLPKEPVADKTDKEEITEEETTRERIAETLTARVELIKSVDSAYSRLKKIEVDASQKTQAHKNKINKLFWDLQKISEGLKESEARPMEEMAQRIEQLNSRIEKINNRILQIKNEIKGMVNILVEEQKDKVPEIQPKPANETAEVKDILQISDKKITKIIEYLDDMAKDGHADSDYKKWANILRTHFPETENESKQVKDKRKLFDEERLQDNFKKVYEHLKLIYDQKQAESMINLKTGEEKVKWEKRKAMLDEIFEEDSGEAVKIDDELKKDAKKFVESATVDGYTVKIGQEVKALRSSGELDAGWIVENIHGNTVTLDKRTSKKGGLKKYDVLISDLKKWNEQPEIVEPDIKERIIIKNEDDIKIGQILRLKRTSGEMDDGWKVAYIEDGKVALQKKVSGGTLNKIVSLSELAEWNEEGDIKQLKKLSNEFKEPGESAQKINDRDYVVILDATGEEKDKVYQVGGQNDGWLFLRGRSEPVRIENVQKTHGFYETPKETIMPPSETMENPPEDIFEMRNTGEIKEQNERIGELSVQLEKARNKLKEAFIKKEKASGFVGKFKKMFGSKDSESANQEYETAWNEYANLQKEMIEASQKQGESLRQFLNQESSDLQAKIGEYYKGKENIISKVWRRLGDMNLYNYLEKKSATVKAMEEQGEEIGKWDKFWANRAKELGQSNKLYKIGAKVLSVRLGISVGLLGVGIFGIPGAAIARGAFVGFGSAMGARHLEDAAQNKIQRWLGNRGEFYSSSEEAQKVMAEKYGLVEKTMDEGADPNEPEDKKTARRRKKFYKMLGQAEKDLVEFESLSVDKRIEKIQEKISAIEAYAYVNGLDLSKDTSYQQLIMAREINMEKFLTEKAVEIGDDRPVVRPDSLEDAMAFLESRKKELAKTAEKVAGEKKLRWAKRLISVAVGAVSGTYAYLATLSRAEIFGGGEQQAPESVPESTETVPETEISSTAPTQPEITAEQNIIPENIEPGSDDLSKRIIESATIRKGEGLERTLQRQLAIDPQKFGYQGDLEDAGAIKKWAGREASLIAQNQGIADKYFIYNEKQPKLLILHEDKTVEAFGRLHHVSEIAKAKAAEAVRLAQESAVESATPETAGSVTDVREVIDIMSGGPKMLTEAEQMEFNRLFDSDQIAEAMEYLMEHRARGPIYETADGLQVHRADIGGWEGNAPDIELPSGSKIEFLENSTIANWKPLSGPTIDIDEYLAERSIPEKLVGIVGEGKTDQFLYHERMGRINDYSQALEQVNPDSDEYKAIVNKLKREFELFNQDTGQNPSEFFHKDFIDKINFESVASKPIAESAVDQPAFDEGIKPEIFEFR